MKQKTLQQHMKEIAGRGGQSTFKKHGRKHYLKMAKARWNPNVTHARQSNV